MKGLIKRGESCLVCWLFPCTFLKVLEISSNYVSDITQIPSSEIYTIPALC